MGCSVPRGAEEVPGDQGYSCCAASLCAHAPNVVSHSPHTGASLRVSACWATYPWIERAVPRWQNTREKLSSLDCPAAVLYMAK